MAPRNHSCFHEHALKSVRQSEPGLDVIRWERKSAHLRALNVINGVTPTSGIGECLIINKYIDQEVYLRISLTTDEVRDGLPSVPASQIAGLAYKVAPVVTTSCSSTAKRNQTEVHHYQAWSRHTDSEVTQCVGSRYSAVWRVLRSVYFTAFPTTRALAINGMPTGRYTVDECRLR